LATIKPPSGYVGDATSAVNDLKNDVINGVDNPSVRGFLRGAIRDIVPTPFTATRTTHALTIHGSGPGRRGIIGAVHAFNTTQSRTTEDVFEVQSLGYGRPADVVPQNLTTRTMDIQRYDLFKRSMEQVFGKRAWELIDLTDQSHPFTLRTTWGEPGFPGITRKNVFEYTGCWFTNLGRTSSATDDRIVKVNATLVWTRRYRVAGR